MVYQQENWYVLFSPTGSNLFARWVMSRPLLLFVACLVLPCSLFAAPPPDIWPAFRGNGDSISDAKLLPLKWSATENIAWNLDLPGYGQSSPVVWKNRIFVTSVEGEFKDVLNVLCVDLVSGKITWQKQFKGTQKVKTTDYVSKAAPTPVVTADRLFVLFESGELLALDHDGKEVWQRSLVKDFGPFTNNHGLGSSPILAGDSLLVLVAQDRGAYLLSVDIASGKDRWRTESAFSGSWSSPTIVSNGDKMTALVNSTGLVAEFDLKTGKQLWEITGLTGNTVASPTVAGNLALIGSSDKASQLAIKLDGNVAWKSRGPTSSFGSPLIYKDLAYSVNRDGIAYCFDVKTGKEHWDTRLPASCWASPIGGAGRVYFFTRDGVCVVVKNNAELETLAENKISVKGRVYGVAAVEGAFVVRTGNTLVRVGK
jgi:outer membrane protein assembly factor BamB